MERDPDLLFSSLARLNGQLGRIFRFFAERGEKHTPNSIFYKNIKNRPQRGDFFGGVRTFKFELCHRGMRLGRLPHAPEDRERALPAGGEGEIVSPCGARQRTVAVPEKIFGLALSSIFSTAATQTDSLYPPPAAGARFPSRGRSISNLSMKKALAVASAFSLAEKERFELSRRH